jgi:hypothetical protein
MNSFDDFDTQTHSDEPPFAEADYDDLAMEADRDWPNFETEIECGKCGTYVYVSVVYGGEMRLVRGCAHYVLDSDLAPVREEVLWG